MLICSFPEGREQCICTADVDPPDMGVAGKADSAIHPRSRHVHRIILVTPAKCHSVSVSHCVVHSGIFAVKGVGGEGFQNRLAWFLSENGFSKEFLCLRIIAATREFWGSFASASRLNGPDHIISLLAGCDRSLTHQAASCLSPRTEGNGSITHTFGRRRPHRADTTR